MCHVVSFSAGLPRLYPKIESPGSRIKLRPDGDSMGRRLFRTMTRHPDPWYLGRAKNEKFISRFQLYDLACRTSYRSACIYLARSGS